MPVSILVCSCLRWRMWAWACGWRSSTTRGGRWRSGTTSGSTSQAATMAISQRTTSPHNTWSACGENCSLGAPSAATWDDNDEKTATKLVWGQKRDYQIRKHHSLMEQLKIIGGAEDDEFVRWRGCFSSGSVIRSFFGRWPVSAADSDTLIAVLGDSFIPVDIYSCVKLLLT